jgi:PadR family transcriptional regulator PadR
MSSIIKRSIMETDIRLTGPVLKVLKLFIEKPLDGKSGADISRKLNISSGTLYPLLARLENAGWMASEWEKIDPAEAGRPRRRFYKLTGHGQQCASKALAELQTAPGALIWSS